MASKERAQTAVKSVCVKFLREHSIKTENNCLIFVDVTALPNKACDMIQKEYFFGLRDLTKLGLWAGLVKAYRD